MQHLITETETVIVMNARELTSLANLLIMVSIEGASESQKRVVDDIVEMERKAERSRYKG